MGHAGASGYIAVLSLFGLAPEAIRPMALLLNLLVASLAAWQFWRAGHFSWSLFWPFALLSVPCAFLGGSLDLPAALFRMLVGIVLLLSAVRLLLKPAEDLKTGAPSRPLALAVGGGLGLLSGLTGTGGGIFLTPLLLFRKWARVREAAAVSALFILLNSAAGLLGTWSRTRDLPDFAWALAPAVLAGGAAGAWLGSRRFPHAVIRRLLAAVLLIAGGKLLLA